MELVEFSLRGVRCFAERQNFRIRPLTLLVGENSTGKTTALGCFQVLASCLSDKGIDFNRDPYEMGNFDNIINAAAAGGTFELSFTVEGKKGRIERIIEFSQNDSSVEPAVKSIVTKFSDGQIVMKIGGQNNKPYDEKTGTYCVNFNVPKELPLSHLFALLTHISNQDISDSDEMSPLKKYVQNKNREFAASCFDFFVPQVYSTAPMRSRPKRTYDPLTGNYDPEGSDVPTRMMRMQATDKKAWQALLRLLEKFGKESQMFDSLAIKNFSDSIGNPFQILVNIDGAKVNIIDVGYGVSQVLPILYRAFMPVVHSSGREQETDMLLFQQPEVHLHPKAQAALASMLVELTKQKSGGFIVETHSRNMIDRVRIEIKSGNIDPNDVSLIYLQPERKPNGRAVTAHNITFDHAANMVGEPPHYAEFLMKETGRMFGFKD